MGYSRTPLGGAEESGNGSTADTKVPGESMESDKETVHRRALELVRDAYEAIASVSEVDLADLNRPRPVEEQYTSVREVIREWASRADAVSKFAVQLGLISSEEARKTIVDFYSRHPNL
jgi:uncharacterized protein YlaN (UPF0358 family)